MSKHTHGPWSQGKTLVTNQTLRWTREELEKNEAIERCIVFSGFSVLDEGRSRRRVAICESDADAILIAAAPELLEAAKMVLAWYEAEENYTSNERPDFYQRIEMCRASEIALRAAIAKATGGNDE